MGRMGFYFNMTTCIGCRTCQIACKDKNDLKIGTIFRQVRNFETGVFPTPGVYHYSGTCNHCANPKCVEGCPTRAMHVDADGTVQHDKTKCIGCRYCTWACPYGVPQFIEELGKVSKCDGCKDLRDQGATPVCVEACPMRALEWGELEELKAKHGSDITNDLPILPPSSTTNPSVLIKAKAIARQKDFRKKEI
ncbi:4Fe-4S dicluster domain-containing protein [Desulfosporosinus meridiei]|uniref:Fe-S-cluster-containing hydrogenase subunit n=1 Tax=Desulfosporosinus meridiei (strain ATCC BAA-275 / DSM 13257 / KCTC 12902 / NCIMB 13706 / S10) TaxID=768704 RepID=J7IMV2_DESMD|nr:4Fe-4S dicluster domain-containing protein [Desulfosporosinus meridiei]AFQ43127.1 Fe-S-cluster-containing hydrogenase subunit [Desulfosporosinus meridiei DSM 13257]